MAIKNVMMKAQFVNENIVDFKRGEDPKKAMDIGMPRVVQIIGSNHVIFEYKGDEYEIDRKIGGKYALRKLIGEGSSYFDIPRTTVLDDLDIQPKDTDDLIKIAKGLIAMINENLSDFKRGVHPKRQMHLGVDELIKDPDYWEAVADALGYQLDSAEEIDDRQLQVDFIKDEYGLYMAILWTEENEKEFSIDSHIGFTITNREEGAVLIFDQEEWVELTPDPIVTAKKISMIIPKTF